MPNKKLEALRERLEKRRSKRKSKRKSKELQRKRDERARDRRIEENEPEGAAETAKATTKQAEELATEARETLQEERAVIAAELGVSTGEVEGIMESASERIKAAAEQGDLSELDIDGDGDTDILQAMDPLGGEQDGGMGDPGAEPVVDPVEAASLDVGADFADDDDVTGVDMSEPIDGEIEF